MSAPKSRRWETKPAAGQASSSQSPIAQLTSFVEGLSEGERAAHRAAYLHLLQSITGSNVTVGLPDGKKLTGVLHTVTPFEGKENVVCVRASRLFQQDDTPIASGASDGKTASLKFDKISSIVPTGKVDLVSKTYSSEFQTDSAIKKHGDMSHLSGRNLQSLDSSWLVPGGDMSLDSKSGKNWDQFEVNKRLFNVKDTYDENLYTKKLDLKSMTAAQIAEATRLAREIEGAASSNIHLQEERGQVTEGDWDEEDKYSGVLRSDGKKPAKSGGAAENNAWTRGVRLGGNSGTSSPSTAAAATTGKGSGSGKTVSPPPGVTMPGAGQATNNPSPKKPAASVAAEPTATKAEEPAAEPAPAAEKKAADPEATKTTTPAETPAPAAAAGAASAAVDSAAVSSSSTAAATGGAAEAAKPAAPKLRASAAEFKPSWMKDPAPPATPTQPVVQPVAHFAPPHYAPNVPYGVPMTPEAPMQPNYGSPNPHVMMASPNMAPMNEMPPPYFDPAAMGMLPPQQPGFPDFQPGMQPPPYMYQQPMMGGMPVPMQGGGMPMDFNNGMPMPMPQMVMGFAGQPEFGYPQMMMMPGQPMQPGFNGMYGGGQMYAGSPQMGGYGGGPGGPGMGSGQKGGYGDKGGMRGPNNKGGRGSGMKPPYNGGGTPRGPGTPGGMGMGMGPGTPNAAGPPNGMGEGAM